MSAPVLSTPFPSAPATLESVSIVRDKLGDARADLLVGQGDIKKDIGKSTADLLHDANSNSQYTNANIVRANEAAMSQGDSYGLASLNSNNAVSDNVTRSGLAGIISGNDNTNSLNQQADTIAWNAMGIQNMGFKESRENAGRIADSQAAFNDRSSKYLSQSLGDSFARLSAQGENGFARQLDNTTAGFSSSAMAAASDFARLSAQGEAGFARQLLATTSAEKQVVQSEIGVTRNVLSGFADIGRSAAENYANLSIQNSLTRETVASYGNRTSDQTASVLASLNAQSMGQQRDLSIVANRSSDQSATAARDLNSVGRELFAQSANNAKENLLENSKWFALSEKTAMVNKVDSDAKLAACCCEIKETIVVSSAATQLLIQSNEATRVRDALAVTVAENAILRLRRDEPHRHFHEGRRSDSPPRRA